MNFFDMYINLLNVPNPDIFFRAGINAYRLGSFKKAKSYFNSCNKIAQGFSEWLFAGCYYWEALLENSEKKKIILLKKASKLPRTLYGQLAIEQLNISDPFTWRNYANHDGSKLFLFKRKQNF